MSTLTVYCFQFSPEWQKPEKNRWWISSQLGSLSNPDVVVLPEMFSTGFALCKENAEPPEGDTLNWMKRQSNQLNSVICGSVRVLEDDCLFNRFYWVCPDGEVKRYDKCHLFGQEQFRLEPGNQRVIVEYKGFSILLQICYDLRFPVFCRNQEDYDVMINVASWPQVRIHHWNALLKARAIENLAYVIGVNRTGQDGNHWEYQGGTQIIAPDGELLAQAQPSQTEIIHAVLDTEKLLEIRKNLPYLKDRDRFDLLL